MRVRCLPRSLEPSTLTQCWFSLSLPLPHPPLQQLSQGKIHKATSFFAKTLSHALCPPWSRVSISESPLEASCSLWVVTPSYRAGKGSRGRCLTYRNRLTGIFSGFKSLKGKDHQRVSVSVLGGKGTRASVVDPLELLRPEYSLPTLGSGGLVSL